MTATQTPESAIERTRAFAATTRGVVLVHSLLAVVFTWPLGRLSSSQIPGGANDIWQCYWNFWWWRGALLEQGTNPLFTDLLFHPHGASLVLHTHSFFNQIVALPVNALLGPASALNFATLLTFAMAGVAAHQLAFEVTRNRGSAYVAGFVFAFFPHHLEQSLEHLNLASIQFLPWVALYALRIIRRDSTRDALLFGGCFALNALACWHYGLFTLFIVPILWLAEWLGSDARAESFRRLIRQGLISLAPFAVLMLPVAWPMWSEMAANENYLKAPMNKGIDLSFLFVPSDHNPLFAGLTHEYYAARRSYLSVGSQAYVGLVTLVLAGLAWLRRPSNRAVWVWSVIALIGVVLAAGAQPTVAGRTLDLPLPHMQFKHLPVLDALRVANRFVVISMLGLSVLAAIGFAAIANGKRFATPICVGLLALDFLWLPYPMQKLEFSPLLERVRDEARGGVLDIPFTDHSLSALNLAYQTIHERPIAGGYISVAPRGEASLGNDPVLWHLSGPVPRVPERIDVGHLRSLGFSHVVLHLDRTREAQHAGRRALPGGSDFYERRRSRPEFGIPRSTLEGLSQRLTEAVGPPAFEDERVRVFRLVPPFGS